MKQMHYSLKTAWKIYPPSFFPSRPILGEVEILLHHNDVWAFALGLLARFPMPPPSLNNVFFFSRPFFFPYGALYEYCLFHVSYIAAKVPIPPLLAVEGKAGAGILPPSNVESGSGT